MNSNVNKSFGNAIASIRKERKLSQEELSFRCGIHRTYLGAIERGEKSPTLATIDKIAKGLNLSIKQLWEVWIIG